MPWLSFLVSTAIPAFAFDTFVAYDPGVLSSVEVGALVQTLEDQGARVRVSTTQVVPSDAFGQRLVVLLAPGAALLPAEVAVLDQVVRQGGRVVLAGDHAVGSETVFDTVNARINLVLTSLALPLVLSADGLGVSEGCVEVGLAGGEPLLDGVDGLVGSAATGVGGGRALARRGAIPVLSVARPLGLTAEGPAFDVVVAGDLNLLVGTCAGALLPGANVALWRNLWVQSCVDRDRDGVLDVVCGGLDCDDLDPGTYPGAVEVCDGVDQDCDGVADDGALDAQVRYRDADADGAGDPDTARVTCAAVAAGEVVLAGDCDDRRADVGPGRPETCDGADQDCDGEVDEQADDASPLYLDADGDGVGGAWSGRVGCADQEGLVLLPGDCDDADFAVQRCPGAPVPEDTDEDPDEEPPPDPPEGGCACGSSGGPGVLAWSGLVVLAARRRRYSGSSHSSYSSYFRA